MIKEPRLRFTEEERADPALEKPIRKAEKAAAKADKAHSKNPEKAGQTGQVDPKTGKVTTKLVLEDKAPAALQAVPYGAGRAGQRSGGQAPSGDPQNRGR